ncbi:vacuolar import and degradation protein [Colletotrichum sojae]|uniref:Vacuolar import and degradation protein n=1 Tax=Colletotrichum sojae TaxID=2175907 RepID=A0A8H6IMG0_9PEZI|nr:vacuolar import and degradation protein [Colletotrichum sojae]
MAGRERDREVATRYTVQTPEALKAQGQLARWISSQQSSPSWSVSSLCWAGTFPDEGPQRSARRVICRFSTGDTGDVYEFVCDHLVTPRQVADFDRIAKECQYERKYHLFHRRLAVSLSSFSSKTTTASPIHSPTLARSIDSSHGLFKLLSSHTTPKAADMSAKGRHPHSTLQHGALVQYSPTRAPGRH